MKNKNKYIEIFTDSLSIEKKKLNEKLKYNDIPEWDSIGHMTLMSALEEGLIFPLIQMILLTLVLLKKEFKF